MNGELPRTGPEWFRWMERRLREQETGNRGSLIARDADGPDVVDASSWPGILEGDPSLVYVPVNEDGGIGNTDPDISAPTDPLPGETDIVVFGGAPDEGDITGPRTPSKPIALSRLGTHEVTWDGLADGDEQMDWDLDYVAVYRSTEGPDFEPTQEGYYSLLRGQGSVVVTGTAYGSVWYYRFVAFDTSGNSSQPSESSDPVTTVALVDTDVIGKVLSGANFMDGTIDTAALADGSISAEKIAADAIDASKVSFTASEIGGISATFAPTAPATATLNDLWYDTDDNNKGYRWDGAVWQPLSAAASVGSSGNAIFYQTSAPSTSGRILNDLWFDTDDGMKPYYWNGAAWTAAVFGSSALGTNSVTATQLANNSVDAAAVVAGAIDTSKINFTARNIGAITTTYATTAPASPVAGDLWFDTDDNMHQWRWSGSAWVDVRDATIAIAQAAINAKARIYYQTTGPLGATLNDLWFDTDDDYHPYYWNGSTWVSMVFGASAIGPNAITATQLADGSVDAAAIVAGSIDASKVNFTARTIGGITTTYAASAPASPVAGDLWFDTDDNMHAWRWSGSAWTDLRDATIAAAQTTADGKNAIFYQTTAPATTGRKINDLWFDTDDGFRPYYWNGTAWTATAYGPSALGANSVTATQLANNAVDAAAIVAGAVDTSKVNFTARAIGGITTTYATTAPASPIAGDLWFDTDDGMHQWRWSGSAWVDVRDALIAAAQTTADGKNAVFYQAAAPPTTGRQVNDLWFDSDDGFKPYYWNGTAWTAAAYGASALAANSVTATQIQNGVIDTSKINFTARTIGGITTTYATTAPASPVAGDLWYDTDDGMRPWRWSGSAWVDIRDTTIAAAQSTATSALTTANAALPKIITVGAMKTFIMPFSMTLSGAALTGSIVIDTPVTFGNYMSRFDISGYNYTNNATEIELAVGGYAYSVGPVWIQTSQTSTGSAVITARLARKISTGKASIILDIAGGVWAYPKIVVDRAIIGQTLPPDTFGVGWTGALTTDLSGYDLVVTPTRRDLNDTHTLTQSWRTTGQVTIDGGKITADSVTANQIAANAITAVELAADSVTATKIAAGAVVAGKIAADSITAAEIAAGAITASELAAGSVIAGKIAAGVIGANEIAADSITAGELAAGAVTADELAANSVVVGKIAAGAVTAGTIAANAVTAGTIAANAVTATTIAAGAITAGKIAAGVVGATELSANSVIAGKIAADAVTSTTIAAGAVTAGKIAANAVTAGTIAAGAVTAASIAAETITGDKIAANAITSSELAAGSVVAGKIAAGVIGATEIAAGAITAGKIAAGVITSTELAANSVITGKIAAGAVTADAIAANAITTDKMLVGDTSNMAEVSESIAGTVTYGTWTSAISGGYAVRAGTKNQYFMFRNTKGPLQFKTGDRLRLSFEAFASATVSVTPTLWVYPSAAAQAFGSAFNITTTPTVFTFEVDVTLATASQLQYLIGISGAGLTTTDVSVRNVRAYVMNAGELIVDGSIIASKIAAGAITAGKIAAGVIGATEIAANSITAGQIATGAITADELAANAVIAGKIAAGAVTAGTIAANAVTATTIAANAVTAGAIAAGAVTAGKVAAGAVTAGTIAAGAIGATELAANSVVAGKIAANAVTAGTIAALAVTTGTIAANAITADKVAAGAITATQLSADAIDGKSINGVTITGSTITGGTVQSAPSGNRWALIGGGVDASSLYAYSTSAVEPAFLQIADDARLIPELAIWSPQFTSGDPLANIEVASGYAVGGEPSRIMLTAQYVSASALGFEAGRMSPTQSYSANTLTAMQWSAAIIEKGMHGWARLASSGVGAAQWVCPEDGVYDVTAVVGFNTTATTRGFINLYAGSTRASRHTWTNEQVCGGSQTVFIPAGDIVKVETYSNTAGSYNGGYIAIYKHGH
jgi:hypothetical protein